MIIALIPARSGSRRVPDKNIRVLGRHPLMAWSILVAVQSGLIDEVYVSTDSEAYGAIAEGYGARVIKRPVVLAGDDVGDFEVISHAMLHMPVGVELVVYLRPTTPFRHGYLVDEAIRLMGLRGYDSLRSVHEMGESAYKCFRIEGGILKPFGGTDYTDLPNQAVERTYHPNGYVDIVRADIVRGGSLWGAGRYGFITPRTVEVDTVEDWEYAVWLAENRGVRWGTG